MDLGAGRLRRWNMLSQDRYGFFHRWQSCIYSGHLGQPARIIVHVARNELLDDDSVLYQLCHGQLIDGYVDDQRGLDPFILSAAFGWLDGHADELIRNAIASISYGLFHRVCL